MTEETLTHYGPCPVHGLFHDLSVPCFYCLVEAAQQQQQVGVPAAPAKVEQEGK